MGKQHNTVPGEQPEMPVPAERPEINQPFNPKERELPQEDPQELPDELPPVENPPEGPPLNPGNISLFNQVARTQ